MAAIRAGCIGLWLMSNSTCGAGAPLEPPVWDTEGPMVWEQSADELIARGSTTDPGYLVSRELYGSLRLRLEVWIEPETNSGVFVGCTPGEAISPTACYEINLWDRHPKQEWRTGALVGISPPLNHVDTLGRWNRLEILIEEKRMRVWINDTLTADWMTEAPRTGRLALQFGGAGAVHVRHLTLEQP
ncbi:protein of unknown function DUF1080 (plasmid) [Allochromatium vinosum DSM 180]|uniref:3-keto-alpha-glucoside-1,2-lyase/3-keto-2-hydroxy-glucal hydratase domain-containing protein n=2 Tax=Allochromatium vinosum TaxID=1049 RepID=D3RW70_ALLVD|nr:protein of unknown function DUF1080 [Allochromatium vinosum DSM 180]